MQMQQRMKTRSCLADMLGCFGWKVLQFFSSPGGRDGRRMQLALGGWKDPGDMKALCIRNLVLPSTSGSSQASLVAPGSLSAQDLAGVSKAQCSAPVAGEGQLLLLLPAAFQAALCDIMWQSSREPVGMHFRSLFK